MTVSASPASVTGREGTPACGSSAARIDANRKVKNNPDYFLAGAFYYPDKISSHPNALLLGTCFQSGQVSACSNDKLLYARHYEYSKCPCWHKIFWCLRHNNSLRHLFHNRDDPRIRSMTNEPTAKSITDKWTVAHHGGSAAEAPPQQPAVGQPVPVLELESQLLDFQRTLSQSAKEHQDFLRAQEEQH